MKLYTVIVLQWIVWSGYSMAEWLSVHDRMLYKTIMFLLFLQIALHIARMILKGTKRTSIVTLLSLLSYMGLQTILQAVLPIG